MSSTGMLPIDGVQYTFRADFPDRAGIQAVSKAPSPVVITDYSIKALPEPDPFWGGTKYQLKIIFSDMPGMNFYRIGVYRRQRNQSRSEFNPADSIYRTIDFDSLPPGWFCGYPGSDSDVLITGSGSGAGCEEFVVTDRLFEGKSYSWSGTTDGINDEIGRQELRLIISSLSEDYYRYHQSSERNYYYDPLVEEPFPVYSNIRDGLGVFAGYTNTYLILLMPSED